MVQPWWKQASHEGDGERSKSGQEWLLGRRPWLACGGEVHSELLCDSVIDELAVCQYVGPEQYHYPLLKHIARGYDEFLNVVGNSAELYFLHRV